jgi:regulator of cell morphogenesis and NO signaling
MSAETITIGALCERHPLAIPLVHGQTPGDAAPRGDAGARLAEAIAVAEESLAAQPWTGAPLAGVVQHLMDAYHRVLPSLFERAAVELATACTDDTALERLDRLREELDLHLHKEETILFPWLASGRGHTAASPIRVMYLEHADTVEGLLQVRQAIGAAVATPAFDALERSLAEHLHAENNILFPRALVT